MSNTWQCGRFELQLERPLLMGIVNVTPDSFSDGNHHFSHEAALAHARQLITEGADILDIGGESTRPGADPVSVDEELRRVVPLIEALLDEGIPLSVDTFKPAVMVEVIKAGADIINDIAGFRSPEAVAAVADTKAGLCIMHMQGEPKTMQQAPHYDDIIAEIQGFLQLQVSRLEQAGVDHRRMMLDPGLGFGKTVAQNYSLLRHLDALGVQSIPWLIGLSRKSMIGHVVGRPPAERVAGSLAGMLAAVHYGAKVLRVHDVAQSADALKVWMAVQHGVSE
ncbi:MAG TPA: dihydropteroate synthase [Paenalcaligenes sp.]|nr:dihydropteroate synthase [Paenalcaligenes sp.]